MENLPENAVLLIDCHYGIYIPQFFAEMFSAQLTEEEINELSSPDNEFYWETWADVLEKEFIVDGIKCYLLQDDDLWAIPIY